MTRVTIHQPAYFPWPGYFDKIMRSDIFVYLDTVQLEKNGFVNRNRIRTPEGRTLWLTVPLIMKEHTQKIIKEMQINNSENWKKKHIKTLEQNYGRTPYFQRYFPDLKRLLESAESDFSAFVFKMLEYFLGVFEIPTRILKSSELNVTSKKSQLVLDICRELGADAYFSGAMGSTYLNLPDFEREGIKVEFQEYKCTEYKQTGGDFIPGLAVVDLLFNEGAEAGKKLISGGIT